MSPPPLRSTLFPYTTLFRSRSWTTTTGGSGEIKSPLAAWQVREASGSLPSTPANRLRKLPGGRTGCVSCRVGAIGDSPRSEEHTSELQSRQYLVCRLLLERK